MRTPKSSVVLVTACLVTALLTGCPKKQPIHHQRGPGPGPGPDPAPDAQRPSGPTYPARPMTKRRTVSVDALAYVKGKPVGVMHPARITVGPNPESEPNVAISGDLSGGLGGSWRAGVWMAAYQASSSVGRELTDYEFSARGYGLIDGPSASALFTAAMMAAMIGLPIRREFTMTGTVNPDGTVGPVGGIPNKFLAAIQKGKKVLGYPVGQRFARDYYSKKIVDLHRLAARAGARAVEVGTVFEAFKHLTGVPFPRPRALRQSEMELPQGVFAKLQMFTNKWAKIFKTYTKGFMGLRLNKVSDATKRINIALKYMKKASQLLQEGSVAAAYDFAQRGGSWAFTSFWYGRFLRLAVANDFKKIFKTTMDLKKSSNKISLKLQKLRRQRPRTVDQLMSIVAAFEQLVEAWAYSQNGNMLLKNTIGKIKKMRASPTKKDPRALLFKWFYKTAFKFSLAEIKQAKAGNFLSFYSPQSPPYTLNPQRLRQVAKIFLAAAQANLIYFEQIFVPQFVKGMGKSPQIIKNILKSTIGKYLLATLCLRFPQFVLSKAWGKNAPETAFAQVAGAMGSYFHSSMLITKYYSLKLNILKKMLGKSAVHSIPRLKALVAMIRHAEESVRINAALAKKYAGDVPTSAKVFYKVGLSMKEMMPSLKIKALEMFWRASMECQLAVMLSRPAGGR